MERISHDTYQIEINEYCDSLRDLKPHIDQGCENLEVTRILIKVDHPEASTQAFQKRLKKIMKYCNDLDREVEVEYK